MASEVSHPSEINTRRRETDKLDKYKYKVRVNRCLGEELL